MYSPIEWAVRSLERKSIKIFIENNKYIHAPQNQLFLFRCTLAKQERIPTAECQRIGAEPFRSVPSPERFCIRPGAAQVTPKKGLAIGTKNRTKDFRVRGVEMNGFLKKENRWVNLYHKEPHSLYRFGTAANNK